MTQVAVRDDLPKLEKYELLEEIGHGGMATVYRAKDLRLGREVAVKIIHRHLRENAEVATRFVAEARAAAKLKHKGIVEVYDVSGEEDRERYLVVELVRGVTLRKILLDHREMPAEIGAAIVIELCEALEHAHEFGIIHRDIKPENVLVGITRAEPDPAKDDPDAIHTTDAPTSGPPSAPSSGASPNSGEPSSGRKPRSRRGPSSRSPRSKPAGVVLKITDFGIAKILDAQGVTSTGQVLGSPAHMAPEQIEGGEVDARTDVFALGVVLYECLVGHLPFDGKNPAQVLRRVLDGKYEPAERERPSVGVRYSRILDAALSSDMNARPATPGAMADLLRAELSGLGLAEPRAEVERYFQDPSSYSAELSKRLVAALVSRAEEARKAKRTADAAADFNRAHALAPDDLVILRRMTQLGRGSDRSRSLRRLGFLLSACVGLGALAYGVARLAREERDGPGPVPTTVAGRRLPPPHLRARVLASERVPHMAASVVLSARPSAEASAQPRSTSSSSSGPVVPQGGDRLVRFNVNPKGAALQIDGAFVDHTSAVLPLPVGKHTAKLSPQRGDRSFDETTLPFQVDPLGADEPDGAVQKIALGAVFKRARVNLIAPSGGEAVCGTMRLGGGANELPMTGPIWEGRCRFLAPNKEERVLFVSIKAGEDNVVAWPSGT